MVTSVPLLPSLFLSYSLDVPRVLRHAVEPVLPLLRQIRAGIHESVLGGFAVPAADLALHLMRQCTDLCVHVNLAFPPVPTKDTVNKLDLGRHPWCRAPDGISNCLRLFLPGDAN